MADEATSPTEEALSFEGDGDSGPDVDPADESLADDPVS